MKHLSHIILTVLFCTTYILPALGQSTATNQTRFSLLTCEPGDEIYTIFGHTAIRYESPQEGIDIVFNYGLFSFSTPNFIWRFVKGETDYMLGATEYRNFVIEYALENRAVWQQTLNLTEKEKETLIAILQTNLLPQNRVYRYNYFYDNCSTRARDRIEDSIDGEVTYEGTDNIQSFRDIVHESAKGYDWFRFGMDFCLGVKADQPIAHRQEMFAPLYLLKAFETASIIDSAGYSRALVEESKTLLTSAPEPRAQTPFTPIRVSLGLFILIALITIYGIKKRCSLWGIDFVLFTAAGLAGCVVAFLTFFSEHPAVSPNFLIAVFHPLHLFLLPFFLRKEAKGRKSIYHIANFCILTLFIAIWPLNPQHFDIAILPLALCLLVRSVSNMVLNYKR